MLRKSLGILLLVAATPVMADISYNYIDLGASIDRCLKEGPGRR